VIEKFADALHSEAGIMALRFAGQELTTSISTSCRITVDRFVALLFR